MFLSFASQKQNHLEPLFLRVSIMVLNASSVHASDHVNGRTAGLILKKASVLGRADSLDSKILG